MKYKFIFSLILSFICNCSPFQLKEYNGFWGWFKGKPGFISTVHADGKILREGTLLGKRHPYYLWLRTPEILFNPQGGFYYPDMIVREGKIYYTNDLSDVKDENLRNKIIWIRNRHFTLMNEGVIEYILPYRSIMDKNGTFDCIVVPFMLPVALPLRIIVYTIHDVIKTVMIPVAAVYYTVKAFGDNGEEEPEK